MTFLNYDCGERNGAAEESEDSTSCVSSFWES